MESFLLAETDDGWSFLPSGIVSSIVAILKRTHCWRRDGRALRRLNKYWCSELNQHVFEIHPHEGRRMRRIDGASLRKFPNVTTVDASPFILAPKQRNLAPMTDAMSNLPKLTQLKLTREALRKMEAHGVSQLTGITSLTCSGYRFQRWHRRVTQLPLQELTCSCHMDTLAYMLKCLSHLRRLNVDVEWYPTSAMDPVTIRLLNALESVSLNIRRHFFSESISSMSEVSSIVSLSVHSFSVANCQELIKLPLLKSLSLGIHERHFSSSSFDQLIKGLTSLKLSSHFGWSEFPFFHDIPVNLQSLHLHNFHLENDNQLQQLTQLTSLSLTGLRSEFRLQFLSSLRRLKKLYLDIPESIRRICQICGCCRSSIVPLHHIALPDLRELYISVMQGYQWPWTCLIATWLSKLEILSVRLRDPYPFYPEGFSALERLKNLHRLDIYGWEQKDLVDWNVHQELWIQLERFSISAKTLISEEAFLTDLKELAPHLMVDFDQLK